VQVAEAFGGYIDDVPDYLGLDVAPLSAPSSMPLVVWLVLGCCIGETVSRALIQARLKRVHEPKLKALVARTLKDENVHVAFGWATARRVISAASEDDRRALVSWCESGLEGVWRGTSTRLLKGRHRACERRQRQLVADAGLGSVSPEEEDAAISECIDGFILPNFRRLGLRVTTNAR
jgi:hypothetical protein